MSAAAFVSYTDKSASKAIPKPGDIVEVNIIAGGVERLGTFVLVGKCVKSNKVDKGRI